MKNFLIKASIFIVCQILLVMTIMYMLHLWSVSVVAV
jgi:hypothetical protein